MKTTLPKSYTASKAEAWFNRRTSNQYEAQVKVRDLGLMDGATRKLAIVSLRQADESVVRGLLTQAGVRASTKQSRNVELLGLLADRYAASTGIALAA